MKHPPIVLFGVDKFVLTCYLIVKDMVFTLNKRICWGGGEEEGEEGREEERKKGTWAMSRLIESLASMKRQTKAPTPQTRRIKCLVSQHNQKFKVTLGCTSSLKPA